VTDERPQLVLVDGANELSGPRALWWVIRRWPALRRELQNAPGYVAHRLWFEHWFTVGLTTWWVDERSVYRFARMPVHVDFWRWASGSRGTKGGWLASYRFVRGGPLWGNGVESMMARLGDFVPEASGEPPPPPPRDRPTRDRAR
jgi:hypothetical protein